MTKTRELIRELLSLINKPELDSQQIARTKDLICYLSEVRKDDKIPQGDVALLETILFSASVKLRTFGYNRLNGLFAENIERDTIDSLRDGCIAEYYKTQTGFVLDRMQKRALDAFEEGNNNGYFDAILHIWADVGEIKSTQIPAIKYFSKNYAENGYLGVLQYRFNRYAELHKADEPDSKFVNDTYRIVFRDVKDTIEYQLPRILSLFETLINRAFILTGKRLNEPLDLSKIIRYFEIGAKTLLGADMIEKGVPIITVRKLERKTIDGDTLREQQVYFLRRRYYIQSGLPLDAYERMQVDKYCAQLNR